MAISAGVIIGSAALPTASVAIAVIVFTLIAGSSVAVPVIGYLVAARAMTKPLESLRAWLLHNNAAVMAVLLLVIGVTMVGKGIGDF